MAFQYNVVACGGTFGPLHKGHIAFLQFAYSLSKKVIIGLTSDAYIKQHKNDATIASYEIRKNELEQFLKTHALLERTIIIPIDSFFGPMLTDAYPVEALVVTSDSKIGAEKINEERQKQHKKIISLEVMPVVATPQNLMLAATHIRSGFMDQNGKSILNSSWFSQNLLLPKPLRSELQQPLGRLLKNGLEDIAKIDSEKIVTVGDVTTKRFLDAHISPKLSVIDFVVERKKTHESLKDFNFTGSEEVFHTANPAGSITLETWNMLLQIVEKLLSKDRFILEVVGEEDLFVLPLLVVLPYGFFIFYGQPQEGLVQVEVTTESKQKAAAFMNKFTQA